MDTAEKNSFSWINKNSENNSQVQNYINRICRSAFASFADLFTHPKMN